MTGLSTVSAASAATGASAANKPRARDLGIPFKGNPGTNNAITDVAGVTIGFSTVIADLPNGKAARTGVTAILPRGRKTLDEPVFAGIFSLNGNGEMTGSHWIDESSPSMSCGHSTTRVAARLPKAMSAAAPA